MIYYTYLFNQNNFKDLLAMPTHFGEFCWVCTTMSKCEQEHENSVQSNKWVKSEYAIE